MFWRHVVASSVEVEGVSSEAAGSEGYQDEHMGLIFEDGLSFSGFERDKVFFGDGHGWFTDLSSVSGADHVGDGRALVVADFDDDGDPDVFLHNIQRERHALYRNDRIGPRVQADAVGGVAGKAAAVPGFVKVRVRGTTGAPDAAGAEVRLMFPRDRGHGSGVVWEQQAQVVSLGSGFVSQHAPELVFGLGPVGDAELSVIWPGGELEEFGKLSAGSRVLLVEGTGKPQLIEARPFVFADPAPSGLRVGVGETLASLDVLDADGEPRTLSLIGEGETLLNLWATTCATCVAEIPDLQSLDDEDGRRVIGLSLDHPNLRGRAGKLLGDRGGDYPNWFLDAELMGRLVDPDRVSIPTTLRLDAEGRIIEVIKGAVEPSE